MVKRKARAKYLFRTIKKNGVSFFAVAFIAATSIAIFLGLQSSATAVLKETDSYFVKNRLESVEIACANGITEEDIAAISEWDNVDLAEGGYSATALINSENEKIIIQARSLSEKMNDPVIIKGVLPTYYNEAAVEEKFANEHNIKIGDEMTLEQDGMLLSDNFVVTAIVNEPFFCCSSVKDARGSSSEGLGSASYYIMLNKEAFDPDYYSGCYTTAYVKNNALDDYYYFSDEYKEQENIFKESLEQLGKERAELRFNYLYDDASGKISEAEKKISDSGKEIADGQKSIDDSKKALENALTEIQTALAGMGLDTELDSALE